MSDISAKQEGILPAETQQASDYEDDDTQFPAAVDQMSAARIASRQANIDAAIAQFHSTNASPRLFEGEGSEQAEDILSIIGALECGGFDFRFGLITQIQSAHTDSSNRNLAIDTLISGKPKDVFEGMLITQMAATHQAAMSALARMLNATQIVQMQAYETMSNKLLRTYAAQMEALRKHRNKATQTVRHVHVHEGGQAIVAETVTHGGKEGGDDGK